MLVRNVTRLWVVLLAYFLLPATAEYRRENAGLTEIPDDIPRAPVEIFLGGNQFGDIPANAFINSSITFFMDLSNCSIRTISPQAFTGTSLQSLYLEDNPLDAIPNLSAVGGSLRTLRLGGYPLPEIFADSFVNMTRMATLEISRASTHTMHPDSLIGSGVTDLRLLDNDFAIIPQLGSHSPRIRTIELTRNPVRRLSDLELSSFVGLRKLILEGCPLTEISARAFCGSMISELNLRGTRITQIPDLRAIAGSLVSLQMTDTFVSVMKSHTFEGFGSLMNVHLSNTRLTCMHPTSFINSPAMFISANNCSLKSLPFLTTLSETLTTFSLLGNEIRDPPPGCMLDILNHTSLRTLFLAGNRITTVDNLSGLDPRQKGVDVNANPLLCDERLAWIKDDDVPRISYYQEDMVCAGPPSLAGRTLGNLTKQELLYQPAPPVLASDQCTEVIPECAGKAFSDDVTADNICSPLPTSTTSSPADQGSSTGSSGSNQTPSQTLPIPSSANVFETGLMGTKIIPLLLIWLCKEVNKVNLPLLVEY